MNRYDQDVVFLKVSALDTILYLNLKSASEILIQFPPPPSTFWSFEFLFLLLMWNSGNFLTKILSSETSQLFIGPFFTCFSLNWKVILLSVCWPICKYGKLGSSDECIGYPGICTVVSFLIYFWILYKAQCMDSSSLLRIFMSSTRLHFHCVCTTDKWLQKKSWYACIKLLFACSFTNIQECRKNIPNLKF